MPKKTIKSLPFKEISPKVNADELIKRLKACLKYVEECDELEDTYSSQLTSLAVVLSSVAIAHHKRKEVQLLSACVLVNLLRLYYPDPPFTEDQMKDVFSLFIDQLYALESPSNPLFNWSFSLLEQLATLKVFTICLNIDAQDTLAELFSKVLSIVNHDQSTKVHMYLMDILIGIIQEGEHLSSTIIDTILINILEPQKSDNPIVYEFTCQLIKKASMSLEPYIQTFFTNVLVIEETSDSDLSNQLYELIHALYNIDSSVLLSVLPQLEIKLKTTDIQERLEVTRLLARMFSAKDSNLFIEYKPLWYCFLGRYQDVSPLVRLECVKFSKYFVVYHELTTEVISEKLLERSQDMDEKVRLEAVKTICEIASENLTCVSNKLLLAVQERMRDKKWIVRKEAMMSLARLYRKVMSSDDESLDKTDYDRIQWIPNKIFHCFYLTTPEDRLCISRCILSCVVPVTLLPKAKVDRLITVFSILDENAIKALNEILRNRKRLRQHVQDLICIHCDTELKEEEKKKLLLTKTIMINTCLPDPTKSCDHLRELVSMLQDINLQHYLSDCVNINNHYEEITKAKGDVLSKFSSRPVVMETVKSLLDMSCPVLLDDVVVKELVGRVTKEICVATLSQSEELEDEEQERCKKALTLVKIISSQESTWFEQKDVLTDLLSILRHKDHQIVQDCLQTLINIGKPIDKFSSIAGCLQQILHQLTMKGSPKIAKYSMKCINTVYSETSTVERLFSGFISGLQLDNPQLHTILVSLSQVARLYPDIFNTQYKKIIYKFIVDEILVLDKIEPDTKNDELWCTWDEVSEQTKLKIAGIKLLVSWIIGYSPKKRDRMSHCRSVLTLLVETLNSDGDLQQKGHISLSDQSYMRLTAASGLLKLSRYGCSDYITMDQFQLLSTTAQDQCDEVREIFLTKLHHGVRHLSLPLKYIAIFCLAGVEIEKEAKTRIKTMLSSNIQCRREYYKKQSQLTTSSDTSVHLLPEYSLPYIVYLLSHHKSFTRTNTKILNIFRDCLWFFLEPLILKSDNYEFLRKMFETIKQTVDAEEPNNMEINKNIYAVCDLAMGILTDKISSVSLGDFPGKVVLPKILFKSRGKETTPNDVKYLPPDYVIFPEKGSKNEAVFKSPSSGTPKKRGRPSKKIKSDSMNDSISLNEINSSTSDIELTPSPVKRKRTTASVTSPVTRKTKGSPKKKQTKLPFRIKQSPMTTSTPAVVQKPLKKPVNKKNAKRKVLQEERNNKEDDAQLTKQKISVPVRSSPRKRSRGIQQIILEADSGGLEEESTSTKKPKVIGTDSSTNGHPQSDTFSGDSIKNRRRVRKRR